MWAVTIFAFLIFLERYFLKLKLEKLGFELYLSRVKTLKNMVEEFNNKLSLDINQGLTEAA